MAYQPKSYRKFVATAATATLVASVVTPALAAPISGAATFTDVPAKYQEGVNYLVDNKITLGLTPETFGTNETITRVDAAVMIGKALEIDVANAPDSGFVDVPNRAKAYVDALKAAGIINGVSATELGSAQEITRGQMALIIAKAYKLTGDASKNPFTDVSSRYADAVAALVDNKITSGTSATSFGTNAAIKRGDFATFLFKVETQQVVAPAVESVTAINGKVTVSFDKEVKEVAAADFKVTQAIDGKEATEVTASAVKLSDDKKSVEITLPEVKKADDEQSVVVAASYKAGEAKSAAAFKVEAAAPVVKSVSAINATQVQVKFTADVDKTDAETAARYAINGTAPTSAVLGADKKTVTLTFANTSEVEVTNGVAVVEPVKTAANAQVSTAKYVQVFTFEDKVNAQVASVEAKTKGTAATSLTVKASEPITSSLVKVNGEYVTANFNGTDTATITGLSLATNKAHTIELINLTDKGGNVTVSTSATFNVTVDTVAPTATLSAQGDKGILVTFSKPMDVASVAAAFGANAPVKSETLGTVNSDAVVSAVADTNDTQFLIPVTSTLYADATSRTLNVVLPGTIQDKLGNTLAAGTRTVTLTKDTAKPVATGYNVIKNANGEVTDIEVTFSEGLLANGNPPEPTIVNENGVAVPTSGAGAFLGGLTADAVLVGDKKVTYSVTTPAKLSGKYAFSFPVDLVTDQAEAANKSAAFNYTVDFGAGTTTFDLPALSLPTSAANVITVEFGRAVKGGAVANSATDAANYTLAGKPLPEGTTILLDTAQDTATITLPAESIAKTDAAVVFTVANVKSLNNETVNNYSGTLGVVDNTKPVLNAAALTTDNKLTVGFGEALTTAPVIGDLELKINGKAVTAVATGTGTTLTVTTGTGSDAGKYLVNIDALVKQGTAAVADDPATTTVDETAAATPTFVDINNNGTFEAAADIKIGDGPVADFKFASSPAITGVTVATLATGASTAQDAAGNKLKNNTVITVK